jgi:PAS domain S-box-containing protein/diguanylate cyclase (GGDEF)-like protein
MRGNREFERVGDKAGRPATTIVGGRMAGFEEASPYRDVFEFAPDPIWIYDAETLRFLLVNRAAVETYGYTPEEFGALTVTDIRPPEDVATFLAWIAANEGERVSVDCRHCTKDGRVRWVEVASHPIRFDGRPAQVATIRDITERRRAQAALLESTRRLDAIVTTSVDGIVTIDEHGIIESLNEPAAKLFGYAVDELVGENVTVLMPAPYAEEHDGYLARYLDTGETHAIGVTREVIAKRRDGSTFPLELSVAEIDPGDRRLYTAGIRDLTEVRSFQQQLANQGLYDSRTALPSRALFLDRLATRLAGSTEHDASSVAVLVADLDHFEGVRDGLGHATADQILGAVADRLRQILRPGDEIARVGEDLFAFAFDVPSEADAIALATLVQESIARPWESVTDTVHLSASVGITLGDHRDASPIALLEAAEAAMRRAKNHGAGNVRLMHPTDRRRARRVLRLDAELRRAIEHDQFVIAYQPIVELATGGVVAVEALARWQHPARGLLRPAEFIPLAEQSDLIVPLGALLVEKACREIAESDGWSGRQLVVATNISARELIDPELVHRLVGVLGRTGLSPDRLVLEITETAVMERAEVNLRILTSLRGVGIRLAIDDFGTGYSSLSYLK